MIAFGDKIASALQAYLDGSSTNEIAVGVVLSDGRVGYYTSKGIDEHSRFDVGSISKTFTAQLILKLAQEGRLSLDDTVDLYLPLGVGRYPTVRQLLTHTAGYRHVTPVELVIPRYLTAPYRTNNLYRGVQSRHVLRALAARKHCKPTHTYGYSDFPYAVLAVLAETVTGRPFADLMNSFLQEDYRFSNTEVCPTTPRTDCFAASGARLRCWTWERDNPYLAGGGIVSTLADLTAYAKQQLQSDLPYVLKAQERHALSCPQGKGVETCLGWLSYRNSERLWHIGGVGSYRAAIVFNRTLGCAAVVLGNAKGEKKANVHYLANLLYGEMKRNHVRVDDSL